MLFFFVQRNIYFLAGYLNVWHIFTVYVQYMHVYDFLLPSMNVDIHSVCDRASSTGPHQRRGHLSISLPLWKQRNAPRSAGKEHRETEEETQNDRRRDLGKTE